MSYKILENNPNKEHIQAILDTLVSTPGVYQYFDKTGKIIYVGKAKNLKNRVLSYFRNDVKHTLKTQILVRKIADIKFVHVSSETEALLMENNLIKKYKPKYNIMLKDDKTYPWIRITNEEYPRIFTTRNVIKDGSSYYGPYASGRILKELMDLLRNVFSYRSCSLNLTEEGVNQGKFKPCLNAQIGLCDKPCIGEQSRVEYHKMISGVRQVIRGNFASYLKEMKAQMMSFAEQLNFEKAQIMKERIMLLENYSAKSTIVSSISHDLEVYSYIADEDKVFINMTKVVEGKVNMSFSVEVERKLDIPAIEVFTSAIMQNRLRLQWEAKEIIVPELLDLPKDYVLQTVPNGGERKKLLDFASHNALLYRNQKIKNAKIVDPERWSNKVVLEMQKDLQLAKPPHHIECFDNSNIQGTNPVASCVVFREGKPSNKEYRHFNVKTVVGPDDFASMREIVFRRYSRLSAEGKELPDLIVIDGGKGQLSSAVEALKRAEVYDKVVVIGLAKRLEEIYKPEDPVPICLDRRSHTLQIIQHIRDEAHRFGITFHRDKRSKATFRTQLTDIDGIGEKTARDLLLKYSSVEKIKNATLQSLTECIGKSKAEKVYAFYHQNKD
ncbi:MAG: excinuclease ABC subunit UvrC [Bacteroidales bacterium]|nr:excinuclease ABC subunit UvrC [Bacteroidales bacterium]MDY6423822.1 excinuclease ABC subunit UvrC [Bacteroidales bacterium]